MAANKVFIVEDDAVIARAVAAHLTTWQMQVQCAGNFEKITEVRFCYHEQKDKPTKARKSL